MERISEIFFGRDKELEILKKLARDSMAGDAESVFISGCRGIGKTALIRHLYDYLFYEQEEAIPFFYSLSPAINSITRFSEDYLVKFIQQAFAFLRKDPEILGRGIFLLKDMEVISRRLDEKWAIEIIEDYLHIKNSHDGVKVFISVIAAPIRACQYTKRPAIILIDDFHLIKELHDPLDKENKDLWLQFEEPIKYPYTSHVFTGSQSLLNKMFFYETSFGKNLRLINIKGLDSENSKKLFISLCDAYRINVDAECDVILDRLHGNPSYIHTLVHSVRKNYDTITEDRLMEIYNNEIRDGTIFKYWTFHLRKYIPLHLRESSLRLLYHLCSVNTVFSLSDMANLSFIRKEELGDIIDSLQTAGIMIEDFSRFRLIDDAVLADVIKETYQREVLKETVPVKVKRYDKRKGIITDEPETKEVKIASDDIVVPSTKRGIIEREKIYIISLIIIVIVTVIAYMNINRSSEEQSLLPVKETVSFPSFHDNVIERNIKTEHEYIFPSFRDEAIAFSK